MHIAGSRIQPSYAPPRMAHGWDNRCSALSEGPSVRGGAKTAGSTRASIKENSSAATCHRATSERVRQRPQSNGVLSHHTEIMLRVLVPVFCFDSIAV